MTEGTNNESKPIRPQVFTVMIKLYSVNQLDTRGTVTVNDTSSAVHVNRFTLCASYHRLCQKRLLLLSNSSFKINNNLDVK